MLPAAQRAYTSFTETPRISAACFTDIMVQPSCHEPSVAKQLGQDRMNLPVRSHFCEWHFENSEFPSLAFVSQLATGNRITPIFATAGGEAHWAFARAQTVKPDWK